MVSGKGDEYNRPAASVQQLAHNFLVGEHFKQKKTLATRRASRLGEGGSYDPPQLLSMIIV